MDVHATTVSVLGLRTRVLASGDASAPPVLLIHGVGGWAENWREVMDPIAQSGRRAIAVDLPGFGESEPPGRVAHFGPREPFYPRFVVALLDTLGLDAAHLVGSSMGGAVAYMAAVSAPERTRSLALVAAGGLGRDIALLLRLVTLPGTIALSRIIGRPAHARGVLRTCFFDASRVPESLSAEAERYGFASYGEFVRALRSGVSLRGVREDLRWHWLDRADRYGGPVLVVWGREDAVVPIQHLEDARAIYPRAQVRVIERCGHLPMVERTREFLEVLLPFLDRADAPVARGPTVAPLTVNG